MGKINLDNLVNHYGDMRDIYITAWRVVNVFCIGSVAELN